MRNHMASNIGYTVPIITKPDAFDIVLLCGSPGAGKSSFYLRHLQPLGYGRVNQDILKTVSLAVLHLHCGTICATSPHVE